MKRIVILIVFAFALIMANAQQADVEVTIKLSDLNKKTEELEDCKRSKHVADSINQENLRKRTQQWNECKQTVEDLTRQVNRNKTLKHDYDSLETELKRVNGCMGQLKHERDSIKGELTKALEYKKSLDYLRELYNTKSFDELYSQFTKDEVKLHSKMFDLARMAKPEQIIARLYIVYNAEEFCSGPYDANVCATLCAKLKNSQSSKIEKKMYERILNYRNKCDEASNLLSQLEQNVFFEPIPEKNFNQLQAKRDCYVKIITFFAQNPEIEKEYPYIFNTLMEIMRSVSANANNFPKGKDPFK